MRQHLAAQPKVSETQAAPPLNLLCLWGPVLWAYNGRGNPVDFQITSGLFFHCFPQWLLLPLRWLTNLIKWFFIHTLRALLRSYMLILFFFLQFYFIFKLYIIVLVLPNIKMNPPAPHERLPELPVVPRVKPHTGAAARENPQDPSVIAR